MKRKLFILLLILVLLAIGISLTPLVDYIYSFYIRIDGVYAEELSADISASDTTVLDTTVPDTTVPDTTEASEGGSQVAGPVATAVAIGASSLTVLIALIVFIRKHNPDK